MGSLLLSPGSWCTRFCLCPPRVCFQVLGKFWRLYGGVNDDLLKEGLCHTQVCCTQNPCPCSRPLLTCMFTGDTQTLKGRAGSVSVGSPGTHKVLYDPYKCLWQVWGLILNAISPLLPSCWVFSFALGCGVSPHSRSSTAQLLLQHLPSCWGFFQVAMLKAGFHPFWGSKAKVKL